MRNPRLIAGAFALVALVSISFSAELYARVVDVGAGECVVIKIPGGHHIVYDAGNWKDGGRTAIEAIREIIPSTDEIDLLILSHSDSDHLGAVDEIMAEYRVKKVVHCGVEREPATWARANAAIISETLNDGCVELNLAISEFPFGGSYRFGDAVLIMVAGFHLPPASWGLRGEAELMNGGSIVVRILYGDKSILLCGDAVGRHIGDAQDACIGSELFMVQSAGTVPIDSDVIVAPHHGADNGSSLAFIKAVSPKFVIFPAGHQHRHPTQAAVDRYRKAGVWPSRMFRTDRGDDEGTGEWNRGRITGTSDKAGDDDVEVRISDRGRIRVKYRN